MIQILRPRKAHQTPPAKEKMRIRRPRPLTAPFSTNLQIRQFLGSLQRLSNYINGGEQSSDHITIWPHPIGFANGIKRLNWTKDFPYLAEYSYFAECFRKKAPGRMWAGLFVTAIESWVGKKVLAEWHVWAGHHHQSKSTGHGEETAHIRLRRGRRGLWPLSCQGGPPSFHTARFLGTEKDAVRGIVAFQLRSGNLVSRRQTLQLKNTRTSHVVPETFRQNQCMKNTCEFLIHTVRSPPRITVGPDDTLRRRPGFATTGNIDID
ncbi:hypothetical protein B0H14DRAFT_3664821 [Mycena olivaceomarginata]|nr:hypothetical protein B0H14DRAFT_3664821 [Mycena olivaceomarginata]